MTTTRSLFTRANFQVNQTPTWKMLSDSQCEDIFLTAIELLERTGADVFSEEALRIFAENGCWVEGNRVRFPGHLTEWAVRTAPSRVTLCDREGNRALRLEANNVHYGPGYFNELVVDPTTDELRKPVKADVALAGRVCDSLKNIDFAMGNGAPTDVTPALADLYAFEALVSNTTKPVVQNAAGVEQMQDIIDIAASIAGGLTELQKNPFFAFYIQAEGGLSYSAEALDKAIFASKNNIPFIYNTSIVAGENAPASPAGAVVIALADALVGIILSQFVRQGASVIAGSYMSVKDTTENIVSYGAPEVSLLAAGLANVLRYMRIPSFSMAGTTDSKISDAQMGMEAAFSLLHAGLSGTNVIYGCGQMESGLTGSLELLVMGDEVMGMVKRILSGIEVDEERLARGVVDRVSPAGHYLGEEHTMKYFRKEFWWPTVMCRNRISDWEAAGAKSLGQRVKEKTLDIIETHDVKPLSEAVAAEIKGILERAEAREAAR